MFARVINLPCAFRRVVASVRPQKSEMLGEFLYVAAEYESTLLRSLNWGAVTVIAALRETKTRRVELF